MRAICRIAVMLLIALLFMGFSGAYAELSFDFGTGLVFSGYNDVRIPNDTGTDLSLSEELKTDSDYFVKFRLSYSLGKRHNISLFAAPLRLHASGEVNKTVRFEGKEFSADIPLTAVYTFNSYRLTYRYDLLHTSRATFGLGVTAKIRDASIVIESSDEKSEKDNIGFVPLINFKAELMFTKKFGILLDGDALAAPQGRAEDVLVAFQYKLSKNLAVKLGYRILEGGADVKEVYNFTLLNYLVAGSVLTF